MVLDGKISEVDEMLLEASEDTRTPRVERRKVEVEKLTVWDTSSVRCRQRGGIWSPKL